MTLTDFEKLDKITKVVEEALRFKGWSITGMYHERSEALEIIQQIIEDTHDVVFCEKCNTPHTYKIDEKPESITCQYCEEKIIK